MHAHASHPHTAPVPPPYRRPDWVIDSTYELFMDLGATDAQCEFPVVYASGVNGIAGMTPSTMAPDLEPLFDTIVREVRAAPRLVIVREGGLTKPRALGPNTYLGPAGAG